MNESTTPDDLPEPSITDPQAHVEDAEVVGFEFPVDEDEPTDVDQTPDSDEYVENGDDEDVEEDEILDADPSEEGGSL